MNKVILRHFAKVTGVKVLQELYDEVEMDGSRFYLDEEEIYIITQVFILVRLPVPHHVVLQSSAYDYPFLLKDSEYIIELETTLKIMLLESSQRLR